MKENFDEENSPTCVLYPNTHTLLCFSSIKTNSLGGGVKNKENVFQADNKNSFWRHIKSCDIPMGTGNTLP